MRCQEAHTRIAALIGDELPETLAAHVERCAACAAHLDADARLRAILRAPAPVASAAVLVRIRQGIDTPARRAQPRFGGLLWVPALKVSLPVAAVLAVAFVATWPRAAEAATPRTVFSRMRGAVLARARSMTSLEVGVGSAPDGPNRGEVGTWVVLDGELTRLRRGGTFRSRKDGKTIVVASSTGRPDLSSLTPAQRAQAEKAIRQALRDHGRSGGPVTYVVDGERVDAAAGEARLRESGVDLTIAINLDESDYRAIAFGVDRDHLVLTPRAAGDRRLVVALDPRSGLPRTVAEERSVGRAWKIGPAQTIRLR